MIDAPKKYFRLKPEGEVRLKGAYIVKCDSWDVDENGNVTCVYCTVDFDTKSGMPGADRKVKGTIHWVSAKENMPFEARLYDVLFLDEVLKKHNDTDLRYLMEIINYRYTNDKKTIITSEKLLNELLDIDEATFGRAVEKCEGFVINIPRDRKKDWRLRSLKL
jgi:hypothetical protein